MTLPDTDPTKIKSPEETQKVIGTLLHIIEELIVSNTNLSDKVKQL